MVDLSREKTGRYKPGQYRPSEEDFMAGFKEKIRFCHTFFFKVMISCLILRLSIATLLSTNLLFAWNQFSFLDEPRNGWMYLSMESVKSRQIKKQNECVIDFY